jgi:DNA-directed RNA polymerase specialized sigma24 family protein
MKRSTLVSSAASDVSVSEPLDHAVRCAACGDREHLGHVARILRPRLIAEAMRRLGPSAQLADAEDVVQELFLTMLEGRVFPPDAGQDAVTWLVRLVATFVPSR